MAYLSAKYRIYPTAKQREYFAKCFGCNRYVYNHFLALQKQEYKDKGKILSHVNISKLLTEMKKKEETSFLKEIDSISLQATTEHLRDAYTNWFREHKGLPSFKKKGFSDSYSTKMVNNNIILANHFIKAPKVGKLKTKVHRTFYKALIKEITISKDNCNRYYVSVTFDNVEISKKTFEDNTSLSSIGIDLGLKSYAILSNGIEINNPKYSKNSANRIAELNRKLSLTKKGSKRHQKARLNLTKAYSKIFNKRKDFLHKLSKQLVIDYSFIAVENLDVKSIQKNKSLAFGVADVAWGEFLSMLEYKSDLYGTEFIKVDKYYPSSQICHQCGFQNDSTKDLSVRVVTCPACHSTYDRDLNASLNIRDEGLRLSQERKENKKKKEKLSNHASDDIIISF